MSMRVVIVDDHGFVATGLALLLEQVGRMEVVATVTDPRRAREVVAVSAPDIVITDMSMPHLDGVAVLADINSLPSPPPVVVLSAMTAPDEIVSAFRAGAANYVFKDAPLAEIVTAITTTANGHPSFSGPVTAALARSVAVPEENPVSLSAREVEILTLASRGLTNRQMSIRLSLAETSVKTYLTRCYAKLGANDRASAVRIAMERGLLTD